MIDHFARCFRYDAWANRKTLQALKALPGLEQRPRKIMTHLLTAQRVWLKRMRGEDLSGLSIWPDAKEDAWEALLEENERGYRQYLASIPAGRLAESIAYRTSTGVDFRTAIGDILTQVLLHGSYHRGQLALAIKAQGAEPPMTDYIAFSREM